MENIKRVQEVDVKVGQAIRRRRKYLGMGQTELAKAAGVSTPQIQKYERAGCRISASKLYDIARALQAPVAYFFQGLDDEQIGSFSVEIDESVEKLMKMAEGAEIVQLFPTIQDPQVRRQFVELLRAFSDSNRPKDGRP